MGPLLSSFAAIAVSALYCLWHHYHVGQEAQRKSLRHRVAHLLWAVATHDEAA